MSKCGVEFYLTSLRVLLFYIKPFNNVENPTKLAKQVVRLYPISPCKKVL
jgi:hypothetical protein